MIGGMNADAWAAALDALWNAVYPWIAAFCAGWYFRGQREARNRRRREAPSSPS